MMACEPHWVRLSDTLVIDNNRVVMARLVMPPEEKYHTQYTTKYPYYQLWLDGRKDYISLSEEETRVMGILISHMAERVGVEEDDG